MTSEAKPRIKVTYATLRADNEELHSAFEEAATKVRGQLGGYHEGRSKQVFKTWLGERDTPGATASVPSRRARR